MNRLSPEYLSRHANDTVFDVLYINEIHSGRSKPTSVRIGAFVRNAPSALLRVRSAANWLGLKAKATTAVINLSYVS